MISKIHNTQTNVISFQRRTPPNLFEAEKAVKKIRNLITKSATSTVHRFNSLPNSIRKGKLRNRIQNSVDEMDRNIGDLRDSRNKAKGYPDLIRIVEDSIRQHKTGNCSDYAVLTQAELISRGVVAHRIRLDVINTETRELVDRSDHEFVLINLDPRSDITKPNTWGKDAVIVDSWGNIVRRSQEALELFKSHFYDIAPNESFTFKIQNIRDENGIIDTTKYLNQKLMSS